MKAHRLGATTRLRPSAAGDGTPANAEQYHLERVMSGGSPMKMNGQSRSFVKQVQADLLALGDADLCNLVHHWIDGDRSSDQTFDISEETLLALGYAPALSESKSPIHQVQPAILDIVGGTDREEPKRWLAPAPQQLRALLVAMDVSAFAQHVITIAYQSLHTTHPEWYDGVTFNAHLANYLRQTRIEAANPKQRVIQRL